MNQLARTLAAKRRPGWRSTRLLAIALVVVFGITPARAADPVRIGVLTDMSGVTSDITGRGSVEAARMAVEDFGGTVNGRPIEVLFADHQHKPDVGAAIAARWFSSDGVNAIVDVPNSAVALAVQRIAREQNRILLVSGAGTTALTQEQCSPNGIHWTYDTYGLAHGTAAAVVEDGGKSWFLLGAEYAFGRQLGQDVSDVVRARGGSVAGAVWHPLDAKDFSSFLLTAQSSRAQVVALANAGGDTTNAIKQAAEFGLTRSGQRLAAMILLVNDVKSLGLDVAQGIYLTTAFYHDKDEASRTWSKRFFARVGSQPSMLQAGVYGSVAHYLKAAQAAGSLDTATVLAKIHELPINDFMTRDGHIREDGHVMREMYLAQVKTPAESKDPWDVFRIVRTILAADIVWPLSESRCPMVKR